MAECVPLGNNFTPPSAKLYIPAVTLLIEQGVHHNDTVRDAKNEYSKAINYRDSLMKGLGTFVLAMINIMKICEMSDANLKNARHYYNKIMGIRLTPLANDEEEVVEDDAVVGEDDEVIGEGNNNFEDEDMIAEKKNHSAAQTSIDYLLEHFKGIVHFATLHTTHYTPVEPEYTIAGLEAKVEAIEQAIDTADDRLMDLSNARLARNIFMNTNHTGLVDVARGVKLYLRNKYGVNSEFYKKVVPFQFIKFTTDKKKKTKAKAKKKK